MANFYRHLFILFIVGTVVSCATSTHVQREPDQVKAQTNVRTAVYQLDDNHQLMLIGMDQTGKEFPGINVATFDGKPGFVSADGQDISNVNPMYLLEINHQGVNRIYDFNWDHKLPASRKAKALPPKLLSIPGARLGLWGAATVDATLTGLKYTPLAFISAIIESGRDRSKRRNYYEAAYLQRLMEDAKNLPDQSTDHPIFGSLNRAQLDETLAALHLRYNEESPYAGLFVKRKNRVPYYNKYFAQKMATISINSAELINAANELNLMLVPVAEDFVIVFAEQSSDENATNVQSNLMGYNPQDYKDYCSRFVAQGGLCPIGVFALSSKQGPQEVSRFADPRQQGASEKESRLIGAALNIGLTFLGSAYIQLAIRGTDQIVRFVAKKEGVTILETTVTSYAQIKAVIDSGLLVYGPSSGAVTVPVVQAALEDLKKTHEYKDNAQVASIADLYIEELKNNLNVASERLAQIWSYAVDKLVFEEQRNSEVLTYNKDQINLQGLKQKHWSHLLGVLTDNDEKQLLIQAIDGKTQMDENDYNGRNHRINPYAQFNWVRKDLNRAPAQVAEASTPPNPVILFMMDGLRPDRFKEAAAKGYVPNLKASFLDRGAEIESYVPRSLTVPSWATILTGFDQDETGVRGNASGARTPKDDLENFIDYRQELLVPKYIHAGRSYQVLAQSGLKWLPRYYSKNETVMGFLPINDGNYPPITDLLVDEVKNLDKVIAGITPGYMDLDEASAKAVARKIQKNPGKNRLVVIWLQSIDEASHYNNESLTNGDVYHLVDDAFATVLEAAKNDPVLKDAQVFMVSDHGHRGGYATNQPTRNQGAFAQKVSNTGFNLTKFFAGDYADKRDLHFTVGAAGSPNPNFDIKYLKEFMIEPLTYTYVGKRGSPSKGRSIIIDEGGSSIANIYLRSENGQWTLDQLSDYQITHYTGEAVEHSENLVKDLLDVKLHNLSTKDPEISKSISLASDGNHPVALVTTVLTGDTARASADNLVPGLGASTRTPLVVRDHQGRTALILTQVNSVGQDSYRYITVRNFSQNSDGSIEGIVSREPGDDPLQYLGKVSTTGGELDSTWRSDRTWLSIAKGTDYPTAVYSMVKNQTLAYRLAGSSFERERVPDLILYGNRGFGFHSSDLMESDHGGLYPEEVKNSFFISGLGQRTPARAFKIDAAVLSKDVTPTILEAAGKLDQVNKTQGRSIFPTYQSLIKGP